MASMANLRSFGALALVALLALFVNVVDAKVKDVTKLQIGVKVIPRQR